MDLAAGTSLACRAAQDASSPRLRRAFVATAVVTFTLLLHVTFPNLGGTGLRMPHNAAIWVGAGVMMAIALWPASRGVIRYSTFHQGLGLLLVALWLPLLWTWNEASLIALPRLLTVTAGVLLLLGLAQLQLTRRHEWWLGMAILAGVLLETALGYAQHFLLEPGNWLGYDPSRGRPYGIFQQVNVMASFLVTGLVVSAWLLGEARNSRLERGVILLAPLLVPALVLVSQSRTGWLAALIAVPLVLLHLWQLDRARFRAWAGTLLVGILLAALVWWAPWAETSSATKAIATPGARLPVYLHSLRMIAEEPLMGWGYGRFQHDFLHSFADWRAALPINQPEIVDPIITATFAHPHNELLYWGIEGGVLPLLALLGAAGWVAWRVWVHGPRGERLLLTALLLPLALHSMTELPFYHSLGHWLAFVLLLGIVAGRCWPTRARDNRYTFGIKVGSVVTPLVLVLFMGSHLHTLWQVKTHLESGGERAGTFTSIVNPFGMAMMLDFQIMAQQLNAAAGLGMPDAVADYLRWAETHAQLAPSPALYANMLRAERVLGTAPESSALAQRAQRLFPGAAVIESALASNASAATLAAEKSDSGSR